LYLFAFFCGLIAASQDDLKKAISARQPYYLIHVMPEAWNRPLNWNPLGALVLKSESEETQIVEIGGQDEGRETRSCILEIPSRTRVKIDDGFFSLSYIHAQSPTNARIGIYSPIRKETYIIGAMDWSNIWVYGMDVLLAGYLTRDEFNRRSSFIQAGARVFQYDKTRTKNLAVPVSDLKPLADLFERTRIWSA